MAADLTWGRQDTLVQPDVFVIAPDDTGAEWADVRRLSLVAAPRRETVALTWHAEGASEPLTIELAQLFQAWARPQLARKVKSL